MQYICSFMTCFSPHVRTNCFIYLHNYSKLQKKWGLEKLLLRITESVQVYHLAYHGGTHVEWEWGWEQSDLTDIK